MRKSTLQRMDEELRRFLRQQYPNRSMTEATRCLAEDLWSEILYGKRKTGKKK
jgi:hypothetical protein